MPPTVYSEHTTTMANPPPSRCVSFLLSSPCSSHSTRPRNSPQQPCATGQAKADAVLPLLLLTAVSLRPFTSRSRAG